MSDLLSTYHQCVSNYESAVRITIGCGSRGQNIIDNAFDTLSKAHQALTKEEQEKYPLPVKARCSNDGHFGMLTGLSMIAQHFQQ